MPEDGAALALPPLREVIARHRLGARKGLGQNFLLDLNLTARIARAAGELEGATVLEVGPGPGGLTRALLAAGAAEVVAIERDRRCLAALEELARAYPGRLRLIEGDALALDESAVVPAGTKVVANLPYNLATPLLFKWLGRLDRFADFTLMFQKEVGARLTARPRSKAYGRLSVAVQWRCQARALFDVPARAFTPPPKVTSTLVGLAPRPTALAPAETWALERVTAAAFGQRRKMLRTSLKTLGVDTAALIARAEVPARARAEEIEVEGFCALARAYAEAAPANGPRGAP
ncbi:MAG: 16S rRNA (adenine(1518)-N(6)/adenine(1519)-N(6))-dimethyltransferase RsmA [Alphaproteobacteria bacterium]|nr:16S rRNA (adenine(1518)-N(6)/adenine(1519)-N(6))-dimethyltransferase RsmA [Alphaproteobacteria bacterium]